jgi:hypothetical protein
MRPSDLLTGRAIVVRLVDGTQPYADERCADSWGRPLER